ncbi:hypothetical protein CALVIDRAFT_569976 [Calocera viscosa TUFC12733]|uniref:Uncharacterized protein n=1 Tax=Calocera viscosa (strain TUFC12733) TaxID=1330018 RepID=A0A167FD76_CALVF|nr:hypothetical protein CALVIDRAFT_569976 [Calocera viscosa TUFC12733]
MARPLKPMPKWCQSVIQSGNESPKKRQKVAASFVGPVKQDENGKDFRELSIQKCIPFITARPDWQRLVTDILRDVIKHKAPDADERAKVDTWAPYDQAGFDEWLASLPPPVPDAASAGGKPATNKVKAGTAPKATTSAAVPERSKKRPTPPSGTYLG